MSLELFVAGIALVAAVAALVPVARAAWRARGTRVIVCPETREPAAVHLDRRRAALGAALGTFTLRLDDCTRWPERRDCPQQCLRQIAAAPDGCRVRSLVEHAYEGQSCAVCGKPFPPLHAWSHQPALRGPDGVSRSWSDLGAESLPFVLRRWDPVCWDCHVVATLYRDHPELIVERPWERERHVKPLAQA